MSTTNVFKCALMKTLIHFEILSLSRRYLLFSFLTMTKTLLGHRLGTIQHLDDFTSDTFNLFNRRLIIVINLLLSK